MLSERAPARSWFGSMTASVSSGKDASALAEAVPSVSQGEMLP